jgi:hypothetical protein
MFYTDFGGLCRLLPDDQKIQERNRTFSLSFHVKGMAGLKLLEWLRKFYNRLGHEARPQICHQRNGATAMVYVMPSQKPISQIASC